jgi:hypothetical protein
MSIEQPQAVKHQRKSAQVLRTLALGVGLVPFVLATPHQAPAAVVTQIDQALLTAPETVDGGDTRVLGQSADSTTRPRGSHPRGPKLPPLQ